MDASWPLIIHAVLWLARMAAGPRCWTVLDGPPMPTDHRYSGNASRMLGRAHHVPPSGELTRSQPATRHQAG